MYENYLAHYGILGMKWGQRKLSRRIIRAEKFGKFDKASKLRNRLEEEKQIEKMDFYDKALLSRKGVLANQRLIAKGQPKAARLIKLHGIALANEFTTQFVAGRVKPERSLNINLTESGHLSIHEHGLITSMGIEAVRMAVAGRTRDFMYDKMGRN